MKKLSLSVAFAAMMLSSGFVACNKDDDAPAPKSLYTRMTNNSPAALAKVVDDFIGIVVADNRINGVFVAFGTTSSQEKVLNLRNHLIDQIGEAAGGPFTYKGKDMITAHRGMNITDAQFNALVEDLGKALTQNGVSMADINELVGILAPLKPQIVGR
ncbi:MAG TPA: group 1 truncated hemoglobin [Chitinophagaceae bacterium]|jgi:hemoglobin|nr:group 1 truncated hemoglobin [Chitinophagaceae bacterium]